MKAIRWISIVLLIAFGLSVFGLAAFADEQSGTGNDSSEPGGEPVSEGSGTESPGEGSGDTSSEDTGSVKITVAGDKSAVEVYFNGSSEPAESVTVKPGDHVTFTVRAKENYKVDSVILNRVATMSATDGVYSFPYAVEEGLDYEIKITATYQDPASTDTSGDTSGDVSGDTSGDTSGDVSGDVSGDTSGDTSGDVSGDTSGDTSGDVSGDTSGDVSGDTSGDVSGDTSTDDNMRPLEITIVGQGSVTCGDQTLTSSGTVLLKSGVATTIRLSPAYGYTTTAIYLDGGYHTVNETLTLTITERTTLSITFSSGSVAPSTYKVTLSVQTDGGYMSASGQTASRGADQVITVSSGSSLPVNVFPANDYEVDAFKVNGSTKNLTNGSFILTLIGADTTVTVSFKKVEKAKTSLEESDINWSADADGNIVVDTGNYSSIGKSVFDKINSLTSGTAEYVVLKTPYVHWYIPCGSQVTGVSDSEFRLNVEVNAQGSYYQTIKASISAQDASTKFNYYEAEKLPTFPEGTKASFYMLDYATDYNGNDVNLMVKSDSSLVVCGRGKVTGNGWTTQMEYKNSRYMVVRLETAEYYTVTANAENGGKVTPSGTNSVAIGENFTFNVAANTGYFISAVTVDGTAVKDAAGATVFEYTIPSVKGDHEINAKFLPTGTEYTVIDDVAVPKGETSEAESDGPNVGLIVALVIGFVAIAGAAVLFIVKWRQEKF